MSNCGETVEIVRFGFEYDSSLPENQLSVDDIVVEERRDIAKNLKKGTVCRLRDEWIFYDKDNAQLYSIDIDNWSKEKIDLELLGINIVDFWCKDFNRQAYILHQKKVGINTTDTQIVVLRSGKQYDIYSRLRTRITNLSNETVGLSAYKVGIDVIFMLIQKDTNVFYLRYLNSSASLRTRVSQSSEVGKTYEFRTTVDNTVNSKYLSNSIKIIEKPPASDFAQQGEKAKLDGDEWITIVNNAVKFTGSSEGLKLVNMKDHDKPAPIEAKLKTIFENKSYRMDVGDFNTGKLFVQSEDNFLVASYSPDKKSDYGVLRLMKYKSAEYQNLDSYYFSYPFNKVTFLNLDADTTLMLIGFNGVVGPTYQAMTMNKFQFSSAKRIQNVYDNRRLTLIKGKGAKNVLAFFQKGDDLHMSTAIFDKKAGGLNDWNLEFDYQPEEESRIAAGVNAFYFVDREDSITFYYNKKSDQSKFLFIKKYDKATNKIVGEELAINLPEGYPKFNIESANCSMLAESNKCLFLAGGSYAIYTEFQKDHSTATPSNTVLLQLTSDQPGDIPYITSTQAIIQHSPGPDIKPDFTFFDLPKPQQLTQGALNKIYPTYKWEAAKGTKVLTVTENSEKDSIIYIEQKDFSKNTRRVLQMESGPFKLAGEGNPSLADLQNSGFQLGSKKLALSEFYKPADAPAPGDDKEMVITL